LTEILVKPIQAGDKALEDEYINLLTSNEAIHLIPVGSAIARRAAQLRAQYKLKTPDAIHIATAIETGCDAFLTNDIGFKRVSEIRVLMLDDLNLDPKVDQP
jgi:predicted nucleic acid-binding protein